MAIEAAGEKLFGEIAVEWGFVEPTYLARAEQVQRDLLAQGKQRRLGEILMESGAMSKPQALKVLKEVKKRQGMKPRIGGYEIQEKIGQGGMGVVYRAKQMSMDRDIALKLLPRHLADDEAFVERFLREARTSAKLNHRNIVTAIDVGEAGGYYYFAMEYVDGQPFDAVLEERERIPESELVPLAIQIVNGLQHAAQNGITHRDIKPGNLMLCRDGVVKIADMGLAVAESMAGGSPAQPEEDGDEETSPVSANRAGTPYYMAPEQVEGTGPFDFRTDFYALGASLFEMATGKKPFDGSSAQAIMAKRLYENPPVAREAHASVSKGLSAVIHKLMQREPDGRYADFPSLLDDLDAVQHRRRPAALREFAALGKNTSITLPRLRHRRTRHSLARRLLTWGGSILFLLICGGFTFAVVFKDHVKGPRHPDLTKPDVRWSLIETASAPAQEARALWVQARDTHGTFHQLRLPTDQDRARVRAAYEAVIRRFPDTVYARMAQHRLQEF